MYMWTRPLIGSDNPDSIKARSLLCGIDGIQAQGLLRNCSGYLSKHTLAIIETYFKLSRQMNKSDYKALLTSSVYSSSKADELSLGIEKIG